MENVFAGLVGLALDWLFLDWDKSFPRLPEALASATTAPNLKKTMKNAARLEEKTVFLQFAVCSTSSCCQDKTVKLIPEVPKLARKTTKLGPEMAKRANLPTKTANLAPKTANLGTHTHTHTHTHTRKHMHIQMYVMQMLYSTRMRAYISPSVFFKHSTHA